MKYLLLGIKKYNLPGNPKSKYRMNMITVGKDNCGLFPVIKEVHQVVCVSQSNITGNFILSGRAVASSEDSLMNNRTVMNNRLGVQRNQSLAFQQFSTQFYPGATEDKRMLTEISTDSINVPPVKRCVKCVGCKNCKKVHLPDQARQLAQAEIVKKSLSFEDGQYKASYPYNKLLSQLEENKEPCLRMMKSLECKLKKEGLLKQFNENVQDFMKRGVIKWTEEIPEILTMQRSYIPLCYTLCSDPEVTTKLRICGKSSFKTGKKAFLNECMIPGPQYLNSIEGILLRWRMANQVAHADIKHCYHKVKSDKKDMSLRRVFLKPDGMGSSGDYWKEACFTAVSFGDGLGGSSSQLTISDCADRFMGVNTRRALTQSIYMDDIMLPSNSPKENIKSMVTEVDSGLKKENFQVKEWTLTGEPGKKVKFLSYCYHAENDTFSVRPKIGEELESQRM